MGLMIKYSKTPQFYNMELWTTVKVHGTQGGVIVFPNGDIQIQSRNNIIGYIYNDVLERKGNNAGFNEFVFDRRYHFRLIAAQYTTSEPVTIFGEFAGKGIQSGVAVAELEKFFMIFRIVDHKMLWYYGDRIFTTLEFAKKIKVKDLEKIVKQIEEECPVARMVASMDGVELKNKTGEGLVVYIGQDKCKLKGEKHRKTNKVKKKRAEINPEIYEYLDDIEMLEKLNKIVGIGVDPDYKDISKYIKFCIEDTIAEYPGLENLKNSIALYAKKVIIERIESWKKD